MWGPPYAHQSHAQNCLFTSAGLYTFVEVDSLDCLCKCICEYMYGVGCIGKAQWKTAEDSPL